MAKAYLGDGVYVDNDGYQLILTAENGITATNTIYLEPIVAENLISYINSINAHRKGDLDEKL